MPKNRRDAVPGAFSALRVSEWSVRRKVIAVLAIPVVLAAVFGGLRVRSELTSASDYNTNLQRTSVLGPAVDYVAATERLALPTTLSDRLGFHQAGSADQQYTTAEANLKRAAASANLSATQKSNVSSMIQIGDQLRNGSGVGLTATAPVQLGDITRNATLLINSTLNTNGTPDPTVQSLVQAVNARLSLVKQQLLIQSTSQGSSLLDSVWLAAEIGVEGSALGNINATGGAGKRVSTLTAANGTRLGEATSSKVSDLAARPGLFAKYDFVNTHLLGDIHHLLAQRAAASKSRALTDTGVILAALLASLVLALLVARALINPLRKVRAGALEVAHQKLPETVRRIRQGQEPDELTLIDVHSHEELGQLARAVDDMHRQAVNLATGEAQLRSQVGAMFVTLSRRNTTLVNQQLALIESLEQDEEDPQRLEHLFSLDHLATRMRRTAESLVILGGTTGRTASFEELSVSDVIHAAVSEVQDYQRVRIDAAPDRMIAGRVAADVVHLMAELIDNALAYSPPGSPVTIQAAEDEGRVEIEIIDTGLGMAGDALAQANEQLKNGGEVTVDTARRMGLFVVSRLAEEHGLKVKLRRNVNGGGIIASIVLPTSVLASDGVVEHVSVLDAPEPVDQPAPVVEVEADEEYDPYLERIEEAIAAVTGLPRRRPGANGPSPEPVATPAAAVSMFGVPATPAIDGLPEPVALPSLVGEEPSATSPWDSEPIALPAAEHDEIDEVDEHETLAEVVTPDFGADRHEARLDESTLDEEQVDPEQVDDEEAADDEVADHDDADEILAEHEHEDEDEVDVESTVDDGGHEPVAEAEPVREPSSSEDDDWGDDPLGGDRPVAVQPVPDEGPTQDPEPAVAFAPVAALTEESQEPAAGEAYVPGDSPVRLTIRRPLSAAPAASALDGDHVPDGDGQLQTPIFGQLRSNWLNDEEESSWVDPEVDRGWNAADRAENADADGSTTRTGLPIRRPGGRLVPGGVSSEPTVVTRDPEAIRNRLAAHAAGVTRGRAAAAAQPITTDYAHEETGPA